MSAHKTSISAYIASLLDYNNIKIHYLKLNPALSVQLGLLSPEAVGEAFVTHDGGQLDKDVGIIERSISYPLSKQSCLTLGQAIDNINISETSSKDCCYEFLSMDEHLVDYVNKYIASFPDANQDIMVIEIGGAITDLGAQVFCKSVKKLQNSHHIYIGNDKQVFTQTFGRKNPDLFIDAAKQLDNLKKRKIPDELLSQINLVITKDLNTKMAGINLEETYLHQPFNEKFANQIVVALVGRYIQNKQAYLSILDALKTAAQMSKVSVKMVFVQSMYLSEKNVSDNMKDVNAVIIPGGFGQCGLEGKMAAIKFARENLIPLFGICLGFQLTAIEFSRHVCGLTEANTSEIDPKCSQPVIHKLHEIITAIKMKNQPDVNKQLSMLKSVSAEPQLTPALSQTDEAVRLHNTLPPQQFVELSPNKYFGMNLGDCVVHPVANTIAAECFTDNEMERHWHSYAMNMEYWPILEQHGLVASIWDKSNSVVVGIELKNHPFFVATQFHPEFKSTYGKPRKIFEKFVQAALQQSLKKQEQK